MESRYLGCHEKSAEFLELLNSCDSDVHKKQVFSEHLKSVLNADTCIKAPDFPTGNLWLNVQEPLSLNYQLAGKIVVLDFFTYCCINCMHILPDLHAVEKCFSETDGVQVIGVHSAKFDNEKISANILSAVMRYNITHPVVNDSVAHLWHEMQIQCWPTIVVLGPASELLLILAGEGHKQLLLDFVNEALQFFKKKDMIRTHSIPLTLERDRIKDKELSFPGKVGISQDGRRLAVSDTGHHRVLIIDATSGIVQVTVGCKEEGLQDGDFLTARFRGPQGVCWHGQHKLFVADTLNHMIRLIDLQSELVTTVAGTGAQGLTEMGGSSATLQPLSSPWDVQMAPAGDAGGVLLIAMAGSHQIWALFLTDTTWWKGSSYKAGTCACIAGSGNEENRNNSYPAKAGFAQPSGLTVACLPGSTPDSLLPFLYVADSESSTIRSVSLTDGSVKNVIGGDIDPSNLFAFGDVDGKGTKAKLQHPLAVAMETANEVSIYVADSYNHKIKRVCPGSRECITVAGSGEVGDLVGPHPEDWAFSEPGGLCVNPKTRQLYIADTNNHAIKVYSPVTNTLTQQVYSQLPVILPQKVTSHIDMTDSPGWKRRPNRKNTTRVSIEDVSLRRGQELSIQLALSLSDGKMLTPDSPSIWTISFSDEEILQKFLANHPSAVEGHLHDLDNQPAIVFRVPPQLDSTSNQKVYIQLDCVIYYCSNSGTCQMKALCFEMCMHVDGDVDLADPVQREFCYKL